MDPRPGGERNSVADNCDHLLPSIDARLKPLRRPGLFGDRERYSVDRLQHELQLPVTGADGEQKCAWNSTWDIAEVDSTSNVPKGYSFVGLTQNLENTISDIASIPATYKWVRSNETAYKGNVCFDFMTSDTKGDSTSSSAQELMLWLRYEGGQLPIGWADGAVATIQLYGKTWKLYQGVNTDTGITVSSLLVDQADQYYGYFAGDIKDWLLAMVKQGLFTSATYVNVGNAGMEPFYGTVSFQNKLGLKINLA
ncbi:hypothetical protein LTS10_012542 [Elasticomyces elasticus]|nr:hypothetical protein LTS10_012542 [Elasticomyces elasticus]